MNNIFRRAFYLWLLLLVATSNVLAQHDTQNVPWSTRNRIFLRNGLIASPLKSDTREDLFATTSSQAKYTSQRAIQAIDRFVRMYPLDARREELNLFRGACYMAEGDFNRARYYLEQVDERSLVGEALNEWKVRTAFSLLKTNRNKGNYRNLFETVAKGKGYWAKVAKLYVASELLAEGKTLLAKDIYTELESDERFVTDAKIGFVTATYYEGQYLKAVTEGEQVVTRYPEARNNPTLLQVMGNAHYRLGNSSKAEQYFTPLFLDHSEVVLPEDRLVYGAVLMELGKQSQALQILKPATVGKTPTAEAATLYYSRALRDKGAYPEAIASYETITSHGGTPKIREIAMYEMALVMRSTRQSNFGQDVRITEEFLNDFPKSKFRNTMERFLIEFYLSNTDYEYSYRSIQRLTQKTPPLREAEQYVLNNLALRLLKQGNYTGAMNYVQLAEKQPLPSTLYYGETLLIKSELQEAQGKPDEAITSLNRFMALPVNATTYNLPEAYYRLGYLYFNKRDYNQANANFKQYFSRSGSVSAPRMADAYARLGDGYFALGNLSEAIIAYDLSSRNANSTDAYALTRKAEILGIQKKYSQQISTLDDIIRSTQSDSYRRKAHLAKGEAYQMAGDYQHAEQALQNTVKQYAAFEEGRQASLKLALLYYNSNRSDAAIAQYRNLILSAPDSREARQAFENLKAISLEEGRSDILQEVVASSKGRFQLSNAEVREMAKEFAFNALTNQSSDAENKLLQFIDTYKQGNDVNEARLKLAEYYQNQGEKEQAYSLYQALESQANSLATQQAVILYFNMAGIEASGNQFKLAYNHYVKSYNLSLNADTKAEAAIRALRIAQQGELYTIALPFANEAVDKVDGVANSEVRLRRGYLLLQQKRINDALTDFERVAKNSDTEAGAEATVIYAQVLLNEKKQPVKAKQILNKFIEKGTAQEYWLARGFILLAEVYYSQGDMVTAKQYIQSLLKNYPQRNDDITERSKQLLDSIERNNK